MSQAIIKLRNVNLTIATGTDIPDFTGKSDQDTAASYLEWVRETLRTVCITKLRTVFHWMASDDAIRAHVESSVIPRLDVDVAVQRNPLITSVNGNSWSVVIDKGFGDWRKQADTQDAIKFVQKVAAHTTSTQIS